MKTTASFNKSLIKKYSIPCFALLVAAAKLGAVDHIVADTDALNTAIAAANNMTSGSVNIILSGAITLNADLTNIALQNGVTLNISSTSGATLSGAGNHGGLVILAGQVNVSNITIANTVAQGGNGAAAGGGGAGMGGAVFVGNRANVTLTSVGFSGNSAVGGNGNTMAVVNLLGGGGGGGASFSPNPNGQPGVSVADLLAGGLGGKGGGENGGNGGSGQGLIGTGVVGVGQDGGTGGGGGGGGVGALVLGGDGGNGGFGGGGGAGGGVNVLGLIGGNGGDGGFGGGGAGSGLNLLNFGAANVAGDGGFGGGDGYTDTVLGLVSAGGGGAGLGGNVFVMGGGQLTIGGSSTQALGTTTGGTGGTGAGSGSAFGSNMFLQGTGTLTYGLASDTASDTMILNGGIADEAGSGGAAGNKWNLNKTGAGKLIVAGDNTYSGVTTISAGTLQIGNGGTTGSINGDIQNDGTLSFNRSDNITYSNVISGTGGVSQDGTGNTTLSGANTYTGATTVNRGGLIAGATDVFGQNSAVTVATGATLNLNNFDQTVGSITGTGSIILGTATLTTGGDNTSTTFSGVLSGTGDLTKIGTGTLTLGGANTYTGATTVAEGTLAAGVINTFGTGSAITVLSGATLDLNDFAQTVGSIAGAGTIDLGSATLTTGGDNASTTFSGDIFGTGGLTKEGTGDLTLSGTNSYTGATTINNGSIILGSDTALNSSGAVIINNPGSLNLNGYDASVGSIAGSGDIDLGTGTLTTGSNNTSTAYNGDISGAGNLIKTGTGTLTLGGTNTYTGTTSVNGGTLSAASVDAFSADSAVTVAAGATLDLNDFAQTVGSIAGAGTIDLGTATLTTGGDNSSTTFSGTILGTGGLTKEGTGDLTLSGSNTYTGDTTINDGSIILGSGTALNPAGAVIINDPGALNLNDYDTTVGSIAGDGDIALGSGTLTTGGNNTSTTFDGDISGTGGLVKNGTGTLTLGGTNTYTGATTVNAGTLAAGTVDAFGTDSAVTVAAGATLDLNDYDQTVGSIAGAGTIDLGTATLITGGDNSSTTFSGNILGTGGLTKEGTGDLTLSGANTYSGPTTINDGSIILGSGTALNPGTAVIINNPGALNLNNFDTTVGSIAGDGDIALGSGTLTTGGDNTSTAFDGDISGTGGLTKEGTGTLTLGGTNTYTAATTVNAGTLAAGAVDTFSPDSAVTLAAGATLNLNNFDQTVGSIAGAGTIDLGTATLTTGGDNSSTTFSGTILGTGGLTKEGTGDLTLSGTNTYSGATTINDGSIIIGSGTALNPGTAVIINEPGSLNLNDFNTTVGSISGDGDIELGSGTLTTGGDNTSTTFNGDISGTGGLIKEGTGTLTLGGDNTYTGDTAVNAGTLIGDTDSLQGDITIATGAILVFDQATAGTFVGDISGAGALIKNGSGDLTLDGTNSYTGGTTLNAGRLIGDTDSLQGVITSTAGTTLVFDQDFNGIFNGAYNGDGALLKEGAGSVTLNGANTYSGGTTINAGELIIDHTGALGSGPVDVNGGTLTANVDLVIPGTIILQNGGVWGGTGSLAANLFDVRDGTATTVLKGAGSMVKSTAGTVTLSGANTHSGGTTVTEGRLVVTSVSGLGTGSVDVNGGTLVANAAVNVPATLILQNNGRWEGTGSLQANLFDVRDGVATVNLVGSGNLTKTTAGTVTLSGTNTYTGTTTVSGGNLVVQGLAALAGDAAVAGGATLTLDTATDGTLTRAISGAGSFVKTGTGTLTVGSGNISGVSGTTRTEAGKLLLNGNGALSTGAFEVASGAEVEFAAHNGLLSNGLSGAGAYRFSGAGTTQLGGTVSGTGELIVGSGHTLDLLGTATTPTSIGRSVRVLAGGELRGSASLSSLNNAGTLRVGSSPGTIVLSGDFVNSGVLNIEIEGTGAGQYDLIQYAGSANINAGSTLNITHGSGYTPAAGDSILFLEDTDLGVGAFTGSFTTENLPTLPPGLLSSLVITSNGMAYTVFDTSFAGSVSGRKGNENFVANIPNNSAGYTPIASAGVINGKAWISSNLTSASPIGLSSMDALILDEGRTHAKFILSRARDDASRRWEKRDEWSTFAEGHGAFTDWKEDSNEGGTFNQRFFGGKAGLSTRLTTELSVGLVAGYDHGTAKLHAGAGKVDQNRGSLAGYFAYAPTDETVIFASVTGGMSNFKTHRYTITGSENGSVHAYDIATTVGFETKFRLSEEIDTGSFAHLTYTRIETDGFTETGSALAARMKSRGNNSLRLRVGQDIGWTIPTGSSRVRLSIGGAFEHEMLHDDAKMKGGFANGTADFTVYGDTLSRNSIAVTPALTWMIDATQAVSASYSYEYGFSKSNSNRFDVAYRISL